MLSNRHASRQARLDSVKAATRDRRAAETPPSRQAIGWVLLRLQLGDAIRHLPWSSASPPSVGTLACPQSFVARPQMLLRLGVRAAMPLRTTLLSTFYGFTHVPAPSESLTLAVSLTSSKPALRLLSRLLAKTYSQIYRLLSTFLCQLSTWLDVLATRLFWQSQHC